MKILVTGGSGFIGTNLVEYLRNIGEEILNIDIAPPKNEKHIPNWVHCDINDKESVAKNFSEFNPDFVIHLAARTDSDGKTINDYKVNFEGTSNIMEVIKKTPTIKKAIFTSTQFVHYNGKIPENHSVYAPYTFYGESKAKMEIIIKNSNLLFNWTIVRPTRVWGPWQPGRLAFYKLLSKGLYIHPSHIQITRAFGYVGNVIYQIMKILEADPEFTNHKVFYVGDYPIDLLEWVKGFARRINNKKILYVPNSFIKMIAMLGDLLKYFHISFPITSYRYKSIITSDYAPMKVTFDNFGVSPYSLDNAIDETISFLKTYHPGLFIK